MPVSQHAETFFAFKPNLIFPQSLSRPGTGDIKHYGFVIYRLCSELVFLFTFLLSGAPLLDRLLALPANIGLGWKGRPGTNNLAYLSHL
jgi:hypothetical protein